MSQSHSPKEYIAPYEMLTEWDEVLLGDEELFKELSLPYIPALLKAARKMIDNARRQSDLQPDSLQPEELVGETLIEAWQARHGRNTRRTLKEWLLEMQTHALQKLVDEEKKLHAPIAVSLEAPLPRASANADDENEYWDWISPPVRERWEDIIPDENAQSIAA